jgi:GntR family transcriptional regulator/MocR family aminotransferase
MSDGPDGLIVGYGAIAATDVDHALDLLHTALERNPATAQRSRDCHA